MLDWKTLQALVYQNKVRHKFPDVGDPYLQTELLADEVEEFRRAIQQKNIESMGEELADIVIYCLGIAQELGIDLGDEVEKKIAVNAVREYPDKNADIVSGSEEKGGEHKIMTRYTGTSAYNYSTI